MQYRAFYLVFTLPLLVLSGCGGGNVKISATSTNHSLAPSSSVVLPPITTVPVTAPTPSSSEVVNTTSTPVPSVTTPGAVPAQNVSPNTIISTSSGATPSTSVVKTPVVRPAPTVNSCPVFPADNAWNKDISALPAHPNSQVYIKSIGLDARLHPDFGETITYGIPYNLVSETPKKVSVRFLYASESDVGPYPIPPNPRIESGGDKHLIVLDSATCTLYELYNASLVGNSWRADSGAIFDLRSNALRPDSWTSADAAGLPIYPGLVRYDEVASGQINHALRFTAPRTQNGYIHPATHQAGENNLALPPMGLRVRLKADYDISSFSPSAQVILTTMKKYGLILADNGSSWFVSGVSDRRWNDEYLNELKKVPGSAFEAVDTGKIIR